MEAVCWNEKAPLLVAYEEHLRRNCGTTDGTARLFVWHVSKFLDAMFADDSVDLMELCPRDLLKYVSQLSRRYAANSRKSTVTALRNFLRWLAMTGCCSPSLINSVPTVSAKRRLGLPTGLTDDDLALLLASFDRSTPSGLRGYAAALCMARLGLRVGEVARLQIDDVDWGKGVLQILKGKGRRPHVLPLPNEVGEAIADYLQHGRPQVEDRRLFVPHRTRRGPPHIGNCRDSIRNDLRRGFRRAGLALPSAGSTRVLRHTMATNLIQKSVALKEIADVLGHRSIDTTGIYTKVDLPALREVAMPWPGGVL